MTFFQDVDVVTMIECKKKRKKGKKK